MADIHKEEITYSAGGVGMKGFLFLDAGRQEARPGVLVVHEWWGCNEYPQRRARMLAEAGYVGMALDLYGDGRIAKNPDEAGQLMNACIDDMEGTRKRFNAALAFLQGQPQVAASRCGAIGYCFGGGVVTHMARMGADLKVTGSFHGAVGLAAVEGPDHVPCRIMVYHGEEDAMVDPGQIDGFKAQMEKTGARYDLIRLPGALHGFSNPQASVNGEKYGLPLAYNALADECTWAHILLTFEHEFRGG